MSHIQGVAPKGRLHQRIETSHKIPQTAYITIDNHRSGNFAI